MTLLKGSLLFVVFTLYLLFGGSVFFLFERDREIQTKQEMSVLRNDIKKILILLDYSFYHNDTTTELIHSLALAKLNVILRIASVCKLDDLFPLKKVGLDNNKTMTISTEDEGNYKWNFYNSVFFAFTVITTIGYGHMPPCTDWSKSFIIIYGLVGIPLCSLLLNFLGTNFSSRLIKVHQESKSQPEQKLTFFLKIMSYIIPGIIVFIILPAGIFVIIEHWTFLDSVYYAFVTLTTIGFGDFVAAHQSGNTSWFWIYKISIIIWITFGLGYLVMILNFISKGLSHKRVRVAIESKLIRDIENMRGVVGELYSKIRSDIDDKDFELEEQQKPVRNDPTKPLPQTHSFPQLSALHKRLSETSLKSKFEENRSQSWASFTSMNLQRERRLRAPVESTSLAEFLQALDNIYVKLNPNLGNNTSTFHTMNECSPRSAKTTRRRKYGVIRVGPSFTNFLGFDEKNRNPQGFIG